MNKTLAIEGLEEGDTGYKYYTPIFRHITATETMSIQDIQLSAEANEMDVNLQKLDFEGGGAGYYYWIPKANAIIKIEAEEMEPLPDGWSWEGKNGCWATDNEDYSKLMIPTEGAELQEGETVQLDGLIGTIITQSGRVSDAIITYPLDFSEEPDAPMTGYRYIGNGFAQAMSIQNIQLNADASEMDANLQLLDFEGGGARYHYWIPKANAIIKVDAEEMEPLPDGWTWEGKNGCWAIDNDDYSMLKIPTDELSILPAGEGVQVDGLDGLTVYVLPPYSL